MPKTSMLYRMWGIVRRPIVKTWSKRITLPWDMARPGSSALDAAYTRSLAAETAVRNGEQVGCILWDFTTFFDQLRIEVLVDNASELGFPMIDLILGMQMHTAPRTLMILGAVSSVIVPWKSILPGCGLAIDFARAYVKPGSPFW